jgi:hypothetical protein
MNQAQKNQEPAAELLSAHDITNMIRDLGLQPHTTDTRARQRQMLELMYLRWSHQHVQAPAEEPPDYMEVSALYKMYDAQVKLTEIPEP